MISVGEAFSVAREPEPVEELPPLDDREQTQLDYLEATVDAGICKQFTGDIFDFRVPKNLVGPKVIAALQKRYREGGWLVAVVARDTDVQVIFAPSRRDGEEQPTVSLKTPTDMPAVARAPVPSGPAAPYRLLVRMPTRGRPGQALRVLEAYRMMAGCPINIEVVVDDDDETMLSAEVLQRLAALDCVVTVDEHVGKVDACNGGRVKDWDILLLASDDMMPVVDGYAVRVIEAMIGKFPHLDGAIFFNDGFQRSNLCTLPIFGRRLYDQFCHVYEPSYQSLFCDREQTDVLQAMGRLAYIDEKLIEHRHHVWGRAEKDALYERNDALEVADKVVYEKRKTMRRDFAQWSFDAPPMWLSILVCSVPARARQLKWLVKHLYAQIIRFAPRQVEVLVDDRVEPTVGEKRQALLERAKGHYVCFIDDDDGVPFDYVPRIVGAIERDPETDCLSLEGVLTTRGGKPERFTHSILHDGWFTKNGIHYRTPNHLNVIRRELALEVGFIARSVGEDHEFSKRIRALLKTEVSTGHKPLYFYWFDPAQSVQSQGSQGGR